MSERKSITIITFAKVFLQIQHIQKLLFLKSQIQHVFSLLFLSILALSIKLKDVHEVIIIGAGIAGIGACRKLTELKIPHLILQSRNRIGGRIYSQEFQGLDLEMGAQYIYSQSNNGLKILMRETGWIVKTVETPTEHFLYQQQGQLNISIISKAGQVHQKLMQKVVHNAFASQKDLSVTAASDDQLRVIAKSHSRKLTNTIKWLTQIQGNIQGADLSYLSARQIDTSDGNKEFIPQKGFHKSIDNIFNQCDSQIHFNERVIKIDYSSDPIRIYTSNNKVYKAKKVISSLPLGVLKAQIVDFQPSLPNKYSTIIDKLGIGNMNKLYVNFTNRFWRYKSGWLNFVTKNANTNKFPIATIIPSQDKHILCFFLAGKTINQIQHLKDRQIGVEVLKNLKKFYNNTEVKVKQLKMTHWDTDKQTLGSYSFYKVGTKMQDIIELRHPIQNKIWFIGQHTHPRYASMTHGAFQTGQWAAQEIADEFQKEREKKQ